MIRQEPFARPSAGNPKRGARVERLELRCDDCDFTTDVDRLPRLFTHAATVHGRLPSKLERTPAPRGGLPRPVSESRDD